MFEMIKGANVGLSALGEDTDSLIVSLSWSSPDGEGDADVSVLLLDSDGKVRGDADFLFYNNPAAEDGSVQLLGKAPTENGSEDRIRLDLTALSPAVDRVVVAASRYGGTRFGELDDLRVVLADRAGDPLLGFSIGTAGPETALLFGELYRRSTEWKFRAIGQGYESGLAGLATDFGIDVDDAVETESPDVAEPFTAGPAEQDPTEGTKALVVPAHEPVPTATKQRSSARCACARAVNSGSRSSPYRAPAVASSRRRAVARPPTNSAPRAVSPRGSGWRGRPVC